MPDTTPAHPHTPEPWCHDEETVTIRYDGRGKPSEGDRIGCFIATPRYRPDGRRIVACVNACAGMTNPAEEIAALRRDAERYRKLRRLASQGVTIASRNQEVFDQTTDAVDDGSDDAAIDAIGGGE